MAFRAIATVHPSYLLRLPDPVAKRQAYDSFRQDLERVASIVGNRRRRDR